MLNFLVRLIYEFFFEIWLCLMMNFSAISSENIDVHIISLSLAIAMTLVLLALIFGLFALFCKWGPYT